MPDITMCTGDYCPIHLRCTCYRYLAEPDPYYQAYSTFMEEGNEECEYYWKGE